MPTASKRDAARTLRPHGAFGLPLANSLTFKMPADRITLQKLANTHAEFHSLTLAA